MPSYSQVFLVQCGRIQTIARLFKLQSELELHSDILLYLHEISCVKVVYKRKIVFQIKYALREARAVDSGP